MSDYSGKIKIPSWQPTAAQAKSNSFMSERPFIMPVNNTTLQAREDLSGYRIPQSEDMINNVRGYNDPTQTTGNFLKAPAPQPLSSNIQPKLTIGEPGDRYEQEADQVAAEVVQKINTPASVQRRELRAASISTLESQTGGYGEIKLKPLIQRQNELGGGEATQELESSINSARGGGQPLEEGLQRAMGAAMGADFSGVRVHTDAQADQLNRSIQAKAFTTGQDVFFRQGEYNPGSKGGQELIAHELTHVVQQKGGAVQPSLPLVKGEEKVDKVDQMLISSGNQANQNQKITPSVEAIQLKVTLNNNFLVKSGRFNFSDEIKRYMNLGQNEHRCHTISYETITNGVKDPINWRLRNPPPQYWDTRYLQGMVSAVYPNGPQAANHINHQNSAQLSGIAETNHATAIEMVAQIQQDINNLNHQNLVNSANGLINALNNSPDNLRSGSGPTNSSIGSAIDPTQDPNKLSTLPVGTLIMQTPGDFNTTTPLQVATQVIRIIDQHEEQIRTLLTQTYSETNEVYGYSSGTTAQSSDNPNQTSASMTDQNRTPIAIEWPSPEQASAYYLWEL